MPLSNLEMSYAILEKGSQQKPGISLFYTVLAPATCPLPAFEPGPRVLESGAPSRAIFYKLEPARALQCGGTRELGSYPTIHGAGRHSSGSNPATPLSHLGPYYADSSPSFPVRGTCGDMVFLLVHLPRCSHAPMPSSHF